MSDAPPPAPSAPGLPRPRAETLVLRWDGLAAGIARRWAGRFRRYVEFADVLQEVRLGFWEAATAKFRVDPAEPADREATRFAAYARRVGASRACDYCLREVGGAVRPPLRVARTDLAGVARARPVTLSVAAVTPALVPALETALAVVPAGPPPALVAWDRVAALLSPRAARVVVLYFRVGLPMPAIGHLTGVSKARVHQVLGEAKTALRALGPAALAPPVPDD